MGRRSLSLVTAAVIGLAASQASAADLPRKAPVYVPPAPPPTTWTGCYIGANVGGVFARRSADFGTFGSLDSDTNSGFAGGGQIGCDYQFAGGWVFGIRNMFDAGVHAHQARRRQGRAAARADGIRPTRSTATRARARARAHSPNSRAASVRVLVATDIAARGIDIEQLPHVINYDLPNVPKTTCTASAAPAAPARTARRSRWCASTSVRLLRDIERLIKRNIARE